MGHLSLKMNYNTMVAREVIIYNVVKGSKPNFKKKNLREGVLSGPTAPIHSLNLPSM